MSLLFYIIMVCEKMYDWQLQVMDCKISNIIETMLIMECGIKQRKMIDFSSGKERYSACQQHAQDPVNISNFSLTITQTKYKDFH